MKISSIALITVSAICLSCTAMASARIAPQSIPAAKLITIAEQDMADEKPADQDTDSQHNANDENMDADSQQNGNSGHMESDKQQDESHDDQSPSHSDTEYHMDDGGY